jgi:thiol:disulfide interchange protein DsbD
MIFSRVLPVLAVALASLAQAAPVVKTEHVEAQLLAEREGAQPGKPATVGLRLRMEPHWHTYWKNPGDSGLPTRIQWTLPGGWTAGAIQWPHPKNLPIGPLLNYGYEDEVVLLVQLTPPRGAKPGPVAIKANADWLVCKEICIPEKGELDLTLNVDAADAAIDKRYQASFERSQRMLPVEATGWKFASAVEGKSIVFRMTPPAGAVAPARALFFPEREDVLEHAAPQRITRDGDALVIAMKLQDPPPKLLPLLKGVVVAESSWAGTRDRRAIEVQAPLAGSLALAAAPASTGSAATPGSSPGGAGSDVGGSVGVALLFALVGGILLNLMPCVFPVLGIKVLGFVKHAHGDAKAMRMQGIVFTLGVVLSFLVLAGAMLALRAGGTQLGWGFQLQSPVFVALLAVLFFVLALNLAGVFEWGLFAQSMTSNISARGRYADAFLAGVLASAVATPCTAPFMGAAVGFTLAQPPAVSLAVFFAIGFGMALPMLLLAFFPALLKRLPKPGPWMETFKQVMAFPLFATVAWLVWVLGAQAGNDAVLGLLAGLVAISVAAWIYGRWSQSQSAWRFVFTALFGVFGLFIAWPGTASLTTPGAPVVQKGGLPWQAWSPEKVAELTGAGHTVFVDFTAAWCVTCQVNKRIALNNEEVVKAFAARGIVPLKADWTNSDPRITQALAALGRNAVPVYALYFPGQSAPRLLPEILTPSLVLDEIKPRSTP